MNYPRRRRPRPFLRSLSDALVFLSLLAMVVLALRQGGFLTPEAGAFVAIDGDSLRQGDSEFRLNGIDAPELQQTCKDARSRDYPCGREARTALRELVNGRTLACNILETDRYGRGVALCKDANIDINAEMVRRGWAIAYRTHSLSYVDEEDAARRARRGIWQGAFEPPGTWRGRHRDTLVRGGLDADGVPED